MSEQNSISRQSIDSSSTECSKSDIVNLALSEEIQTQSLESHIRRFESGDESLPWTRLMEWFVEAVIGVELFRNEHHSAPPLTSENIRIDSSSTIVIAFPYSPDQPSISGSLSSDISTLCSFFLHIHRTLIHNNLLIIPLDPDDRNIVFARLMVALVEHFVASGDLILPNSSPSDHSQSFSAHFRLLSEYKIPQYDPLYVINLAAAFINFIRISEHRINFILPNHSFLLRDGIIFSEELLDVVKTIKETHSLDTAQNVFYDWTEWVKMMETIEKDATLGRDLSFLQSRCLRASLLSLHSKHQLRANPPQTEESNEAESSSNEIVTSITRSPSVIDVTWNLMDVGSSQFSTAISTQTSLPSDQSSSDSRTVASDQLVFHAASFARHSQQILSAIHLHLTRHHPTDFTWDVRPSFQSDSFFDSYPTPDSSHVDLNEKFDVSLFNETDDRKVVASLRRCLDVVKKTKSAKCIADVHTFRTLLITGLHSSDFRISLYCSTLFFALADLLPTVDDPRDSQFQSLRMAFFDGTFEEKITLLKLWMRWLNTGRAGAHSFFPMDLIFELYLRSDPNAFFTFQLDVTDCSPRKFLSTPYVGLHSLLLRSPNLNLNQQELPQLIHMFFPVPGQDTNVNHLLNLFRVFPPPRLIDTLLASPNLIRPHIDIWTDFLAVFCDFSTSSSPFGVCSSLATVFKMLSPFDSRQNHVALDRINIAGDIVVSLHWLSIPAHFDSPLLCHLPSLAGAQRGVLQTLSSHSGIPSLLTPLTIESFSYSIRSLTSSPFSFHDGISKISLSVRYVDSDVFRSFKLKSFIVQSVVSCLLSPIPAVVSTTFEFLHRFVNVSSDAVRIKLVKQGLLGRVIFAVSCSSFLDDYEKGIAVIGILLDTIRRNDLKQRMIDYDLFDIFDIIDI
ncbi:hypothetical protein BLNAU_9397 [Blattamonas nauphoetae]|uniref:Uncharacterized protein n=1 Tax=Blattamonas nauphoetae TaxID=2049346 RepID=A0ABQ9XW53_9EUKA|nr:hypothetical protein BLNAU_9397 [Blattamonas nauphoetae]